MNTTDLLQQFWSFLVANFVADVKADAAPDLDAILAIVEKDGIMALLQPANALAVNSFLLKLQADAFKVGDDLSKQIATFWRQWLAAKVAVAKAPPQLKAA